MDLKEYFNHKNIKGNAQSFIAEKTAQTLLSFCEQESEFAQAIEQSGKSFQDCLDYVIKGMVKSGSTGSLSDCDAYNRAVRFYFPGAVVHHRFELDLIGNAKESTPEAKSFDFMSLMDW
ncbi:MAG: hypothetical protein K2J71_04840 [Oscillospiraceae bacterium]|nr:hypothetical protein [Oscillospiraceae bacterium]